MSCRGICEKYRIRVGGGGGRDRYADGQKRCSRCGVFMLCKELRCPCCRQMLKVKPKNSKDRRHLQRVSGTHTGY